ncbi:MAG: ATP phosphoribosyltransferase regulatory subunit [Pseudomonadota bacterium]
MTKSVAPLPQTSKSLLPSGFSDLLPPEAGLEADTITHLLKSFKQFGFDRIKPPLAEFEDSLFAPGPGASLVHNTFRVMDPVSHRMMGIRSDITAQIARIASSRLQNEPRPLRLCYANDVLRIKGSQARTARQFTQIGCEIIGEDSVESDIEIAVVAVKALISLGVQDLTLDMNLPRLPDMVFAQFGVSEAEQEKVLKALGDRDQEALDKLGGDAAALFKAVLSVSHDQALMLKTLSDQDFLKDQTAHLEAVYQGVQKALKEMDVQSVKITLDVLETSGLEYHNGVTFSFFSAKVAAALGRGGRYKITLEAEESAAGFTLYTDTLMQTLPKREAQKRIAVDTAESWGVIQSLQDEGWIVLRVNGHNKALDGCTHKFDNGNIIEV